MKKSVNKSGLASLLSEELGLSHKICLDITSKLFSAIIDITYKESQELNIKNFGKFLTRRKKARPGRDIGRDRAVEITTRDILAFSPSRKLKKLLNTEILKDSSDYMPELDAHSHPQI